MSGVSKASGNRAASAHVITSPSSGGRSVDASTTYLSSYRGTTLQTGPVLRGEMSDGDVKREFAQLAAQLGR